MYKIVKSTDNGLDEMELDRLEKGYWLDIVASYWYYKCRTAAHRECGRNL